MKRSSEEVEAFARHPLLGPLAAAFEQAADAAVVAEAGAANPMIVHANPAFTQLTGYRSDEVIGGGWRILQGPAKERRSPRGLVRALDEGRAWRGRVSGRRKDGSPLAFDWRLSPIRYGDEVALWVVLLRDAEADIMAERYRDFAEAAADLFWETDEDHRYTYMSEGYRGASGMAPQEALGLTRRELVERHMGPLESLDSEKWREHFRQIETRQPFRDLQFRWMHPDGHLTVVRSTGKPIFDRDGSFRGYRGTTANVTETAPTQERYQLAAAGSLAGIWDWNLLTNEVYLSPTLLSQLGYGEGQSPSTVEAWQQLVHPDDRTKLQAAISELAPDAETFGLEHRMLHKDGSERWVLKRGRATRDRLGNLVRVVGTDTDITALKEAERDLRKARDDAERANLAKSRFLASASHDLRQPLQAVRLLLSASLEARHDQERREIASDISAAVKIMGSLLDTVLDISKLDAGVVKPEVTDFPVSRLLERLRLLFEPQILKRGPRFRVVPCSVVIRSDFALLAQIVENLVSNAVRHAREGKIVLGCRRRPGALRIEVWDSGVGIPEDKLEEIFEEFVQLGNPARDREQGLGLGLAIVDRLRRLLGHRLDVVSRPGKGSMFAVEVPLGSPSRVPPAEEHHPDSITTQEIAACVLVVEDDFGVRRAIGRSLEHWGAEVMLCSSLPNALQRLARAERKPDLVITDFRLPNGETGVGTIARIREAIGAEIPGIIITGDTSPATLGEIAASRHPCLHKPVSPGKLRALIRHLTAKPEAAKGGRRK